MIRDGVQVGTGDPMAVNNSLMFSYRNSDLDLDKIGLRSNKEKSIYNIPKRYDRCYIQI